MNIKNKALEKIVNGVVNHAPEILTGIGTGGLIATVILAVKETPPAIKALDEKKEEMSVENLPRTEIVKTAGKIYLPAIILGTVSTVCIMAGTSVGVRRNATLAATYGATNLALAEAKKLYNNTANDFNNYKKTVENTVNEKKLNEINDKVADKTSSNISAKEIVYLNDGAGELFWDSIGGRQFESTKEKIKEAVNEFNRMMLSDMYGSLNELYSLIGLEGTYLGAKLGWVVDELLEVRFDEAKISPDGKPCLIMSFNTLPKYEYDRML